MNVTIYCDGAAVPNPGHGSCGVVLLADGKGRAFGRYLGDNITNNHAEIMAAVCGLQALKQPCTVEVISDSQYVVKTMTDGWKRSKNKDLWAMLDKEVARHTVTWTWVRGHDGNTYNEMAHDMADKALEILGNFEKGYFTP